MHALNFSAFYINVIIILYMISSIFSEQQVNLQVMNEEELRQIFDEEKYVITLFSDKPDCTEKCEEFENSLVSIREDLVEDTGGWVVRSYAPSFASELGLKESSVIFMRNGRPLLYTGKATDDDMLLNFLSFNKESFVHNFTDETFEHETQVGTGATTGDWLIMFSKREQCIHCQQLVPIVEAVASKVKGRKNVAYLEREVGAVTARRFGVKTFPTLIFFRLGKMYRYDFPIDVTTIASFIDDGFRNAKGERVPHPKTFFDDITEATADWMKENPGTFFLSFGGLVFTFVVLLLLNRPPPESWTKKNKKKYQ